MITDLPILNYYSLQLIRYKITKLLHCLPTNPYDWHLLRWLYHTCSETKFFINIFRCVYLYGLQTNKVSSSLSTAVYHTHVSSGCCLLAHRPSVNMSEIDKVTTCLYTETIVTKLPFYPHAFSCYSSLLTANICHHNYDASYPQILNMINTPVFSSVHIPVQ